jgi:hypothetical protein
MRIAVIADSQKRIVNLNEVGKGQRGRHALANAAHQRQVRLGNRKSLFVQQELFA